MNTPLDLDQFVAIIDAGSISAAARDLGEARATMSRRLTRLEESLGIRLVHRKPGRNARSSLTPTRAGLELYNRAVRIVAQVRAAESALRRLDDVPRGPLRVTVPSGPTGHVFGRLFSDFLCKYPEVEPEILAVNRHVDLVGEGFDVALRAGIRASGGPDTDRSMIRRVVLHNHVLALASPDYLNRAGRPEAPSDLANHRCIAGFAGGERRAVQWPLHAGGAIRITPVAATNDPMVACELALAGRGIALLPSTFAQDHLDSGALEQILPRVVGASSVVGIVYPERRLIEPAVKAFVDHAMAWFKQHGDQLRPPPHRDQGNRRT